MNITREQREQLNALSKRIFGSSSKWQKLVNKGHYEVFTRDREAMIPGALGMKKKTFTDKKSVLKHYTIAEVLQLMLDILKSRTPNVGHAVPGEPAPTIDLSPLQSGMTVKGDGIPENTTVK